MRATLIAIAVLSLAASAAGAPTHDHAAVQTLGTVSFPTSCTPAVQPQFNTAVALMHSFQFGRAIDTFNAILGAEPDCTMAYWGIALSNWSNPFAGFKSPGQLAQGLNAVQRARAAGTKTPRERAYVEAVAHLYVDSARIDQSTRVLAYEQAMAAVSAAYPQDVEATIFYALALAAAADPADKTYAKQLKAGALLEALFARLPDHPGLAHYIIHAYDEPALASRAAEAARRYGSIAPSTPHALHMPSHTFTRVGDWQASIDTNRASAEAARKAGQPADILHASDYLIYGYLQTGRDQAAQQLVRSSADVFRAFDPQKATGAAPASAAYYANAAIPARFALERHAWAEAARLEPLASPFANADAVTYFARGLGAAYIKDGTAVRSALAALGQLSGTLAKTNDRYWVGQINIAKREIAGQLAFAEGNATAAFADLRAAATLEEATQLASVTPGPLVPARELLGELLITMNRSGEALAAFRASLKANPNRLWSLCGAARAAALAGDRVAAQSYARQTLQITAQADGPRRPELAEMERLADEGRRATLTPEH